MDTIEVCKKNVERNLDNIEFVAKNRGKIELRDELKETFGKVLLGMKDARDACEVNGRGWVWFDGEVAGLEAVIGYLNKI